MSFMSAQVQLTNLLYFVKALFHNGLGYRLKLLYSALGTHPALSIDPRYLQHRLLLLFLPVLVVAVPS